MQLNYKQEIKRKIQQILSIKKQASKKPLKDDESSEEEQKIQDLLVFQQEKIISEAWNKADIKNTRFPIGVTDFCDMITKHQDFYADKTFLIKNIMDTSVISMKTILITRPSGWGKSLNLSMMKYFLKKEIDENGLQIVPPPYRNLFLGGKIVKKEGRVQKQYFVKRPKIGVTKNQSNRSVVKVFQGTFPVISLDFGSVDGRNYLQVKLSLLRIILKQYIAHPYLKFCERSDSYLGNIKNLSKWIDQLGAQIKKNQNEQKDPSQKDYSNLNTAEPVDCILRSLQHCLETYNKDQQRHCYLLIDHYDEPIHRIIQNNTCPEQARSMVEFICKLLSPIVFNARSTKVIVCGKFNIFQTFLPMYKQFGIFQTHYYYQQFGLTRAEITSIIRAMYGLEEAEDQNQNKKQRFRKTGYESYRKQKLLNSQDPEVDKSEIIMAQMQEKQNMAKKVQVDRMAAYLIRMMNKFYGNFNCGAYNLTKIHPEAVIRFLQNCLNQKKQALPLQGKLFWDINYDLQLKFKKPEIIHSIYLRTDDSWYFKKFLRYLSLSKIMCFHMANVAVQQSQCPIKLIFYADITHYMDFTEEESNLMMHYLGFLTGRIQLTDHWKISQAHFPNHSILLIVKKFILKKFQVNYGLRFLKTQNEEQQQNGNKITYNQVKQNSDEKVKDPIKQQIPLKPSSNIKQQINKNMSQYYRPFKMQNKKSFIKKFQRVLNHFISSLNEIDEHFLKGLVYYQYFYSGSTLKLLQTGYSEFMKPFVSASAILQPESAKIIDNIFIPNFLKKKGEAYKYQSGELGSSENNIYIHEYSFIAFSKEKLSLKKQISKLIIRAVEPQRQYLPEKISSLGRAIDAANRLSQTKGRASQGINRIVIRTFVVDKDKTGENIMVKSVDNDLVLTMKEATYLNRFMHDMKCLQKWARFKENKGQLEDYQILYEALELISKGDRVSAQNYLSRRKVDRLLQRQEIDIGGLEDVSENKFRQRQFASNIPQRSFFSNQQYMFSYDDMQHRHFRQPQKKMFRTDYSVERQMKNDLKMMDLVKIREMLKRQKKY